MSRRRREKLPNDILVASRGKEVTVKLRDGTYITGKLESYDNHMNILLHDATIKYPDNYERHIGDIMIRGDNVMMIVSDYAPEGE